MLGNLSEAENVSACKLMIDEVTTLCEMKQQGLVMI